MSTENTQVITFELGEKKYCIDLEYVAEIVDRGDLTPIPNSPEHVEGVMDLRGETTTIINPKEIFDLEDSGSGQRIIILDTEEENIGWQVDEVYEVTRIESEEVDKPVDKEGIKGVFKEDEGFVIWVEPIGIESLEGAGEIKK